MRCTRLSLMTLASSGMTTASCSFSTQTFLPNGFGYVALQPGNNKVSLSAMHTCMHGGEFLFMTMDSTNVLHLMAYGCRRTRGNEKRLLSHLGECFSGDWAINKCHHMCFGQRFTWTTDCHAVKFILSYKSKNPAILCLQMCFMCWDIHIEHHNDIHLAGADYLSRLGSDLCYDPLLRNYVERVWAIKHAHPSPSALPMEPKNMPYYQGPHLPKNMPTSSSALFVSPVTITPGSQHLMNWPVSFGFFTLMMDSDHPVQSLYNSDSSNTAGLLAHFDWAVYRFNSGHFVHTIRNRGLPFHIVLAADSFANGLAPLKKLTSCPTILSGAPALLDHMDPASPPNLLDFSFTCIATKVANPPKKSGIFRLTLSSNSASFNLFPFSQRLFILITTDTQFQLASSSGSGKMVGLPPTP
jgi:hypothetical protein